MSHCARPELAPSILIFAKICLFERQTNSHSQYDRVHRFIPSCQQTGMNQAEARNSTQFSDMAGIQVHGPLSQNTLEGSWVAIEYSWNLN